MIVREDNGLYASFACSENYLGIRCGPCPSRAGPRSAFQLLPRCSTMAAADPRLPVQHRGRVQASDAAAIPSPQRAPDQLGSLYHRGSWVALGFGGSKEIHWVAWGLTGLRTAAWGSCRSSVVLGSPEAPARPGGTLEGRWSAQEFLGRDEARAAAEAEWSWSAVRHWSRGAGGSPVVHPVGRKGTAATYGRTWPDVIFNIPELPGGRAEVLLFQWQRWCPRRANSLQNQTTCASSPRDGWRLGASPTKEGTVKLPRRKFLYLAAGAAGFPRFASRGRKLIRPADHHRRAVRSGGCDGSARAPDGRANEGIAWSTCDHRKHRGGEGSVGVGRVARAAPDGYTLVIGHWSTSLVNGALYSLPYDLLHDFEPISLISSNSHFIVARKTLPATNLKEMIAWLKDNPDKASPVRRCR